MFRKIIIIVFALLLLCSYNTKNEKPFQPDVVSRLHTLSVHLRVASDVDSVFNFLKNELNLPVYYMPGTYGQRRYAGIYAGNLVLEPCGPYADFQYATNNFRAIFFGLTFEPKKNLQESAWGISNLNMQYVNGGDQFIYLKDSLLCKENITISIMDKKEKKADYLKMDSLKRIVLSNADAGCGIIGVKEVIIGYVNEENIVSWNKFLNSKNPETCYQYSLPDQLTIKFEMSTIKEVKGIIFRIKSLDKAIDYLKSKCIRFNSENNILELERVRTFGLLVRFAES